MGRKARELTKERIEEGSIPEPNSGCWLWEGAHNEQGYGKIRSKGVLYRAHRASYLVFNGELEEGKVVMHLCNNPACVNPAHLTQGTYSENTSQMYREGRNHTNYTGHLKRGRRADGTFI
jgi:hypothetical protein